MNSQFEPELPFFEPEACLLLPVLNYLCKNPL